MSDYLKYGKEFGGTVMNMGLSSLTLGELLSLQRKSAITSAVLEQTLTHTTMIKKTSNTDDNQGEGGEF